MATLVFPSSNTWITPRTEIGEITTSNCKIALNRKIDKLNKVLVDADDFRFYFNKNGNGSFSVSVNFSDIYSDKNCTKRIFNEVDISKYVVEEAEYRTLNKFNLWQGDRIGDGKRYLSNTFYYGHNGDTIVLTNDKLNNWENVTDHVLIWCFFDLFNIYSTVYFKVMSESIGADYSFTKNHLEGSTCTVTAPELRKWKFRVYYTPLGESVKLQVPKTNPQPNQFCIPYSQQQPIVDNVTFGREMQSVANRAGCEKREVVRTFSDIKDYRDPNDHWYYEDRDASG